MVPAMLTVRRPPRERIDAFLAAQAVGSFSYAPVGGTGAGACPPGFNVDHHRIRLGAGEAAHARLSQAPSRSMSTIQIEAARRFYESRGFSVVGRSPTDGAAVRFPSCS